MQLAHIKALETGIAKYPPRRVKVKPISVPAGLMSINQEDLFHGQLPKHIVIRCVDSEAFNGQYASNPFFFKHNHLNFIALYADGVQVPAKPLQPNFANDLYSRSYASPFNSMGTLEQMKETI